ncbi:HIT zinc finger protein [Rutstroemia sp. NJR-2017a BBW]|nr:HIT zinc finger protein [Rutstroemia sp. NJR-2017a BBW]PQE08611.1 HIT zinc finger protein [Rutstroemia sp. NJR-2017a BBW]
MNFGVVELATSRNTLAPGWAYVPDVGTNIPSSAIQPSARRAARGLPSASTHETTAKQDAKILRELAALDRENHRDVNIPVPVRHRDNAGRVTHGKVTPAVRKILASQKTFANHLSDYEALAALPSSSSSQPAPAAQPAAPTTVSTPTAPAPNLAHPNKRSHKRKEPAAPAAPPEKRSHKKKDLTAPSTSTPLRQLAAPLPPPITLPVVALSQGSAPPPKAHPGDIDPLLVSRVPTMPTQEELERLLAQPPLSYNEARGGWTPEDRRKPMRVFCEWEGVCVGLFEYA